MVALAGALDGSAGATFLFYGGVVALAVMLVESLIELRQFRERQQQPDQELQALRTRLERQASEVRAASGDRHLASLLKFVGETAPTVAELSLKEPQILDGWFDLLSSRVQRETGTGYAQMVLLREALIWTDARFASHYEVAFRGGSNEFGLSKGRLLPATDVPSELLLEKVGAGSVYVSEFSFADEPYWLCLLLSTSARHEYLETLTRIEVAVVLMALSTMPPAKQRARLGEVWETEA